MQDPAVPEGPPYGSINVLYEDEAYVVFDKPPGLLVIPTPHQETNTLADLVNRACALRGENFRLHPCHRLDRETSGAIIFAKGKKNQQLLMELFHRRAVSKKYLAFVHGRLPKPRGEFRSAIRGFEERKFHKNPHAKLAITRYNVVQVKKRFSVVEVFPMTGRTNQIRIQFSEAGFPLVGERKYAFAKDFVLKFRRAALHASDVQFTHPLNRKKMHIVSPLPADMKNFLGTH